MERLARLRWQCRRGMLELDCLLERFLEEGYGTLSAGQRAQFHRLLEEDDPRLFHWLLQAPEAAPAEYLELIRLIRRRRPA